MFDFFKRHKGSDATIPNGAPVVLELDPKLAEALEQVEEDTIRNINDVLKRSEVVEKEVGEYRKQIEKTRRAR